jgi:hypothetical protein
LVVLIVAQHQERPSQVPTPLQTPHDEAIGIGRHRMAVYPVGRLEEFARELARAFSGDRRRPGFSVPMGTRISAS